MNSDSNRTLTPDAIRTFAESLPQIMWWVEAASDEPRMGFNRRWFDYTGLGEDSGIDNGWLAAIHPDDRARSGPAWLESARRGAPYRDEGRLRSAADVYRWHLFQAYPHHEAGQLTAWMVTATDIDDQKQAEAHARQASIDMERAILRLSIITEASRILSAAPDYHDTIGQLAQVVVPAFVDFYSVHVVTDDSWEVVASRHSDPAVGSLASAPDDRPRRVVERVLADGVPLVLPHLADIYRLLPELEGEAPVELGPRSLLAVPLEADGARYGVLILINADAERRLGPDDVPFASELAHRIARAVRLTRGFQREAQLRHDAERARDDVLVLQRFTERLALAVTPAQVLAVTLRAASEALGAVSGVVGVVEDGGEQLQVHRLSPDDSADTYVSDQIPADADRPLPVVARRQRGLYFESREAVEADFPGLRWLRQAFGALAVIPIAIGSRTTGALALSFAAPRTFDSEACAQLDAIAGQSGAALERTRAYDGMQAARHLAEATSAELAGAVRERDAALLSARAQRDWLQQVIDVLPEGVVIVDDQGRTQFRNRAAERLSPEAQRDVRAFHPDGTPFTSADLPLSQSFHDGSVVRGVRMVLRGPGMPDTTALVSAAPMRESGGTIVGAVGVIQDISDLRALERAREEFVEWASHDMRTPLTVVKTTAQRTLRAVRRAGDPPDRMVEALTTIIEASNGMNALVEEMLEAAHVQAGRPLALRRSEFDLALLASEVARSRFAGDATQRIVIDAPEAGVVGSWDRVRLARAIETVVSNAIQYSSPGSTISLDVAHTGTIAVIRVCDEGPGFDAAGIAGLLDPFGDGRGIAGRTSGGIGLAGARAVVEQHGGRFRVDNIPAGGAVVTIELPIAAA